MEDPIKQWLLTLAVKARVPLKFLFPVVRAEILNLPQPPAVSDGDRLDAFFYLLSQECLEVVDSVPNDVAQSDWSEHELRDRILSGLTGRLNFGLTQIGGLAWERVAEPDWSRFISHSATSEELDLASTNFERLGAHLGWIPAVEGVRIKWETLSYELHESYPITYWKRLSGVHRVQCKLESRAEGGMGIGWPQWFSHWHAEFHRWFRE